MYTIPEEINTNEEFIAFLREKKELLKHRVDGVVQIPAVPLTNQEKINILAELPEIKKIVVDLIRKTPAYSVHVHETSLKFICRDNDSLRVVNKIFFTMWKLGFLLYVDSPYQISIVPNKYGDVHLKIIYERSRPISRLMGYGYDPELNKPALDNLRDDITSGNIVGGLKRIIDKVRTVDIGSLGDEISEFESSNVHLVYLDEQNTELLIDHIVYLVSRIKGLNTRQIEEGYEDYDLGKPFRHGEANEFVDNDDGTHSIDFIFRHLYYSLIIPSSKLSEIEQGVSELCSR